MKRSILFLFITFIAWHSITMAQPICDIKEYTIKDGLAQSIISGLLQDKKGFMWFSTWDGLNKFDGYTFKKYKSIQGDGSTLVNNRLNKIVESQYGDIWCLTYLTQAFLFDSGAEKFIDVLGQLEAERQQTYVVKRIISLPKGIAWILCDNGYNFRVDEKLIKENEGITLFSTFDNQVKGENVYNVYQDADGEEWILTNKGTTIVGNKTIHSDFPFQHVIELNNEIWLARTNAKLARYDKESSIPCFIDVPTYVKSINVLEAIDKYTLALGTNKGLVLFDTRNATFKQISILTTTQHNENVTHIFQDKTGELWLLTQGKGVTRVNLQTNEVSHLFTPHSEVVHFERPNTPHIFEDALGTLWVLPRDGNLSYFNRNTNSLEYYYQQPGDSKSAFHPYMRHLCTDRQGNIWFASTRGVNKMSFTHRNYEQVCMDNGMEVRAFLRDKHDNFWIASKSGKIKIFDRHNNLRGYLSDKGGITKKDNYFLHNAYCFMEDLNGDIWIGTRYDGIFRLEKDKEDTFSYSISNYRHDPADNYSLSNNSVYTIFQDSKKRIWVGSYQGGLNLISFDKKNKIRFIHNGNHLNNYPPTHSSKVRYITQIGDTVMMVGTTDGLLTFSSDFNHPEEIKFYRNIRQTRINSSIGANDVLQIFTDSREDIYVVTFSGGINKVMPGTLLSDNIVFKAYTERNGLASDLTLSMTEDQSGYLWIASENALTRFDPQKETFENYDQQFLPRNAYFSEAIPGTMASGEIVFGTDQGIVKINPYQIYKSNYVPNIVFTDMKTGGTRSYNDIDNIKKLVLKPSQRNITLQFAALDFRNSRDIHYAYRLKGLEDKWNYAEKNRTASYLNIPKGKYDFEVKSTNRDGVWVENMRTLTIEVLPTFWETIWAWFLYFLLFIMLTGSIVYVLFYIYRLRHRVDMEQQLSNIKLRFFTDISHELRTPLTLISTPVTEVLEHEPLTPTAKEHLTLVQKNTNRMLELINQILDFRKIQNKKMKVLVEETEVNTLLFKIAGCFQLIAEEKQINFDIRSETENIRLWLDKDKFEKIFYNLISNAFKYTPVGKSITIQVIAGEEYVTISIIDEGIGIQPHKLNSLFQRFETLANGNMLQPSSGIGLSLVKELVELHHGSINVISEPGKGSEFQVSFPVGKKHFQQDVQAEFILADSHPDVNKETEWSTTDIPNEKVSILIVEDNDELRKLLRNILSGHYTIIEAINGKEGLNNIVTNPPDLIISDVMMPIMDGLDMVSRIKENPDICHIPIVLLSAKSALDDRIKGLEYGIDDYITKPFSATYLKTRISSLLKQRKQLQERYMANLTNPQLEVSPSEPQIAPFDERFIKQAVQFIEDHIDQSEMTIDEFAGALMVSRTVFYRKLKTLVGLSPVDFIREIRVKRAAQLIDVGEYTFSQIAYMCGFNDPKYFAKCFKKRMGITPSEYKESKALRN